MGVAPVWWPGLPASLEAGLLPDSLYQALLQVFLGVRHGDGPGLMWMTKVAVASLDPVQGPAIGFQLLYQICALHTRLLAVPLGL